MAQVMTQTPPKESKYAAVTGQSVPSGFLLHITALRDVTEGSAVTYDAVQNDRQHRHRLYLPGIEINCR